MTKDMNDFLGRIPYRCAALLIASSTLLPLKAQSPMLYSNAFSNNKEKLQIVGRGDCSIADGVLKTNTAYCTFGDHNWKDYSMSFRARAPKDAEQVQIWAGFRASNRYDRYVVGIKGGLQDDIYLMRLGYMGTDELMGVRPLRFHPVPGEWYKLRVEVCGKRLRVFVGDEKLPYIDVTDENSNLAPQGEITLGGGWINTEYDDVEVKPLAADAFKGVPDTEFNKVLSAAQKEEKRKQERAAYQDIKVTSINNDRTEVSLDGNWLFKPEYEDKDGVKSALASTDDSSWHVMSVPNFWNPMRIHLHGEVMPSPRGDQPKGASDTYYQMETDRCENYTFDFRKTKAAWYRQWLELPKNVEGKNMTLTFDAISKVAEVYVNGELAASHVGMYGEIAVDCSKLLKPGKNLIAVKVTRDFIKDIADADKVLDVAVTVPVTNKMLKDIAHGFYQADPAGIWQPVKLTITNQVKIEDVFIKPALDGATFDVTIKNHDGKKKQFAVNTEIIDHETGATLYKGVNIAKAQLKNGEENKFTFKVDGLKPRLWTPEHPNLYDFNFSVVEGKNEVTDVKSILSGFRTFEVKDGMFYLNGVKYWLRGGNHTPFGLAPNDLQLANTFMQLMKQGNIEVTRTHTTPWNQLWMGAADKNGIGVSFEGTWPWLMIHSTPIPDSNLLELWRSEYLSLLKKNRNHPSLFFWTINNEMKFYDNDADTERAKKKFQIISDVVKQMREIDPTRPICFDSNYQRKGKDEKFGKDFMASVDDGDIDDVHAYYNWYDFSLFRFFNGEFQKQFKLPNRPLISQEMSTGYPNNETGHPTRSYQLIHQNPMSLIGYQCYDFADPNAFLKTQSFITGELAEALRRSDDQASGIMHFALLTWFKQVYDSKKITPWPTYYALKRALQPVLVSAELWGRHFYNGEKLPTRIYVVNDRENGTDLQETLLRWQIVDEIGKVLNHGEETIHPVKHYGHDYIVPNITLPADIPADKVNAKLLLTLTENGLKVSENEYELLIAKKQWGANKTFAGKKIVVLDKDGISDKLAGMNIKTTKVSSVADLVNAKAKNDLAIISGVASMTDAEVAQVRAYLKKGGKVLFLNCAETVKKVFPEYVRGVIVPTEGDICFMERDDDKVFDGIEPLELRYFNNNKREIPLACNRTLQVNRNENLTELAGQMKIHAYIDAHAQADRLKKVESMRGLTMFRVVDGKGRAMVSTMCLGKADADPIAARLLSNTIAEAL